MEDVQINGNFKFQTIDFIIIAYIYPQKIKDIQEILDISNCSTNNFIHSQYSKRIKSKIDIIKAIENKI